MSYSPRFIIGLLLLALTGCAASPPISIRTLEKEEKSFDRTFRVNASERRLLRTIKDAAEVEGRDLWEAGLIASGLTDADALAQSLRTMNSLENRLRQALEGQARNERDTARIVLTWMHDNILKKYHARQSSVRETLNSGEYNCVSATLLFNGMLHRFGIRSKVVDSPTHVLSRAYVDGTWVEVETTNPRGFAPFRSEEEYRNFLRSRGLRSGYQRLDASGNLKAVLIPRRNQRLRLVENRLLPGFIVWNDAVIAAEQGRRGRAWKLYEMATRMLPDEQGVRHNADVFLNNLAYQHIENEAYAKALRLLLFADHEGRGANIRANIRIMMAISFDRLASQAVDRMDMEELEEVLRFGHEKLGKNRVLDHNHALHVGRLAKRMAAQGELRKALKLMARHMTWDKDFLSSRYAYMVSKVASSLQSQGDKEQARKLLEREIPYLTRIGGSQNNLGVLEEMLGLHYLQEDELETAATYFRLAMNHGNGSSARVNLGVCYFNLAVKAFNERACARAQHFAAKAKQFQESPTLDRIQRNCLP